MNDSDKNESHLITLNEAVETLSQIACLELPESQSGASLDLEISDKSFIYHTFHQLHSKNNSQTIKMIKETFNVILNYLRDYYKKEKDDIYDNSVLERIKTIMFLVGEASKKLDKYTVLFNSNQKSIKDLKEYKKLQNFYITKIDKKREPEAIEKWIASTARKINEKSLVKFSRPNSHVSKHIFIDLDSVKRDTDYELFFLRKEDGSRFFSPRLIHNMKLINYIVPHLNNELEVTHDPFDEIDQWPNLICQQEAKHLLEVIRPLMEKFFSESLNFKDRELVERINKALMALMLAANDYHLEHELEDGKGCAEYFYDFQMYFRQALHSKEYQGLITTDHFSSRLSQTIVSLLQRLCFTLYSELDAYAVLTPQLEHLFSSNKDKQQTPQKESLVECILDDYQKMNTALKVHMNKYVENLMKVLEEGKYREFDPLLQGNHPSALFDLTLGKNHIAFKRWASPTHQEFINKATLLEEFKGFLHSFEGNEENDKGHCLFFNFQDRLNWKEQARLLAIEAIEQNPHLNNKISFVTLCKDSDFYHQTGLYENENHAQVFINELKKQLIQKNVNYHFQTDDLIVEIAAGVHKRFFSTKNVLSKKERLNFIEIVYLFLQKRVIELINPSIVGFSCKDGLDISIASGIELFIFYKFLNHESITFEDQKQIERMLFSPLLVVRERTMLLDRFERMIEVIKFIENNLKV